LSIKFVECIHLHRRRLLSTQDCSPFPRTLASVVTIPRWITTQSKQRFLVSSFHFFVHAVSLCFQFHLTDIPAASSKAWASDSCCPGSRSNISARPQDSCFFGLLQPKPTQISVTLHDGLLVERLPEIRVLIVPLRALWVPSPSP
jgi:hypothetical protein